MYTFEDKLGEIDAAIERRRHKWHLEALAWMDYDDVAQLLRMHIHRQWEKWDQTRPFDRWVATVVHHKTTNLLRNLYFNVVRPCVSCEENNGHDRCKKYGTQCNNCPLYDKWERTKQSAFNIKMPVSTESHVQAVSNIPHMDCDIEDSVELVHTKMKAVLTRIQYKVYKAIYIDGKTYEEAAKEMEYSTTEKGRTPGYKQIKNMEKVFLNKARQIILSNVI